MAIHTSLPIYRAAYALLNIGFVVGAWWASLPWDDEE